MKVTIYSWRYNHDPNAPLLPPSNRELTEMGLGYFIPVPEVRVRIAEREEPSSDLEKGVEE